MKGSVRLPRPPVIEQYLFHRFVHLLAVWRHIPLAVEEARVLRNFLGKVDKRFAHFVFADNTFQKCYFLQLSQRLVPRHVEPLLVSADIAV